MAGLLRREPGLALLLALAMFTLMGLPPTPGFWGKLALFGSALTASRLTGDTWLIVLVIIAVLNSALAAAYYLRVIAAVLLSHHAQVWNLALLGFVYGCGDAFFFPAYTALIQQIVPREAQSIGALLCGFLILIFTFYPSGLMRAGQRATRELSEPRATAARTEIPVASAVDPPFAPP